MRFFCYGRFRFYNEHGVRKERTRGGRKVRYHQDLEAVRAVARYNLGALPDARAYLFEVSPLEDGHVLKCTPEKTFNGQRPHWAEAGKPVRLVFLEEVRHTEDRVVLLTERLVTGRKPVDDMDDFLRSKGHAL